jgi:hypothetical protein
MGLLSNVSGIKQIDKFVSCDAKPEEFIVRFQGLAAV